MGQIILSEPRLAYFEKEDILHLYIPREAESNSVELSPNVTAELNEEGELIGIEILNATAFIRDSVLDSAQAKLLHLFKPPTLTPPQIERQKVLA